MTPKSQALLDWQSRKARHVCRLCGYRMWWVAGEKTLCRKCGDAYVEVEE